MKADVEFVRVGRPGQQTLLVWNRPLDKFETFNGRDRWPDWTAFFADLEADFSARPWLDRRDVKKKTREYADACPTHIKAPPSPALASSGEPKKKESWWGIAFTTALLAGFAWLMLYGIWDGLKPTLGSLGLIEYKSPAAIKYERFLATVTECKEDKRLFAGNGSSDIPSLQVFSCPGGEERIWSRRVEVVHKMQSGKWLIE